MQIVVPIKQVPETGNVKMDPLTGTMVREGQSAVINPLDLYAIETAVRLSEQSGGRVVALSMGPLLAEKALREAIAIGCDDGVLLSDKRFAGSDTWATSYALSQAIRKLGKIDLVLCGERATDGDTGQVGPGIAAFLDLPLATYVSRITEVQTDGLYVERLVEGGKERVWTSLPAVLTVLKEIADPRFPTLRGKLNAKHASIPTWGPAEIEAQPEFLGLAGSPTRVVKIDKPQVARAGELLAAGTPAEVEQAADQILAYLRNKHFI